MAKRSITDQEIALIKAMLARGMANKDIQFYFNRQDRPVNSGRITGIRKGAYGNSRSIPAASGVDLDGFLAVFKSPDLSGVATPLGPKSPLDPSIIAAFFKRDTNGVHRLIDGESDTRECKLGFGLRHSHLWVKAVAALAIIAEAMSFLALPTAVTRATPEKT